MSCPCRVPSACPYPASPPHLTGRDRESYALARQPSTPGRTRAVTGDRTERLTERRRLWSITPHWIRRICSHPVRRTERRSTRGTCRQPRIRCHGVMASRVGAAHHHIEARLHAGNTASRTARALFCDERPVNPVSPRHHVSGRDLQGAVVALRRKDPHHGGHGAAGEHADSRVERARQPACHGGQAPRSSVHADPPPSPGRGILHERTK